MLDMQGKVAVVTGAASKHGLGCAIALLLAREGADVVVTDKDLPPESIPVWDREAGWKGIDSLAEQIRGQGRRSMSLVADITKRSDVDAMVKNVVKELGHIDILINNAAIMRRDIGLSDVVNTTDETWNLTMSVNLTGTFMMCRAVAKQMIEQGKGGKIVNISSIGGKRPLSGRAPYAVSKAGVIMLTQVLAVELGKHKINVNAVCPGVMVTWGTMGKAIYAKVKEGMSEDQAVDAAYRADPHVWDRVLQTPLQRQGKPTEVAEVAAFLASGRADFMTGQSINVDGGQVTIH